MANALTGKLYTFCEWVMRFAYVNILWIVFSLFGLVVFGFFPATAALFSVIRKWMMKDADIAVFKTFWTACKKEFFKSNILGYIFLLIGTLLYTDYLYLQQYSGSLLQLAYLPLLFALIIYLLMLLYVFPIFVHYDLKVFQVIKNALLIVMINPLTNLLMITGCLAVYFVMISFQGLIPFFAGSVPAYIIMWFSYKAFYKIEQKRQRQ